MSIHLLGNMRNIRHFRVLSPKGDALKGDARDSKTTLHMIDSLRVYNELYIYFIL